MIIHMEFHQSPERDKYHTYWKLQLTIPLNTIKKRIYTENLSTNNASVVGQICKNCIQTCC